MFQYRDFRRPIIVFSCLILLLVGLAPLIVSQFKPQPVEAQTATACQPRPTGQFAASLVGKVEEVHALNPQRRPVAGATVTVELMVGGQSFSAATDASGQYKINLTLTTNPANVRVYISAQDFFARERWILLKSGENSFNPDALISLAGGWDVVFENNVLIEKHTLPPRWVGYVSRRVRKSDPNGNPYDTTERVNGVTITLYERLDRGFKTPIASGVSQHRADPIDPSAPGEDGYIEITKPASYVFGRSYVTKASAGFGGSEGLGMDGGYSNPLGATSDHLTVEGIVTQENSTYRIPQARFKITQGKISYPLEGYGSTNPYDQGSYVYESDYYGYLPATTQLILPLRPGPATIQIFMLKAEGQLDPTPVATKAVTLTSGRNAVDVSVPLVTLCGRLALSEDPALTFPGVPLEFKQHNGEATQKATTDTNGNFSTAQEVGGANPSWAGPGYALSFGFGSTLKPGYLDVTQKFSQAKEPNGELVSPAYRIMRDSKTTFQAQSGGGIRTNLKGALGDPNRIEGTIVLAPSLTVTNQWDLDGFEVELRRVGDNLICVTKTASLVPSGVLDKASFSFNNHNCLDLRAGEYETYVGILIDGAFLRVSDTVRVVFTKNTDEVQNVKLTLNQIFPNLRYDLRIRADAMSSFLLEESGQALEDAKVTLFRVQHEGRIRKDVELGSKMTNANGRVTFPNLTAGLYKWKTEKAGYLPMDSSDPETLLTRKYLHSTPGNILKSDYVTLVNQEDPPKHCEIKTSNYIKFIFCSLAGKALYPKYPTAWPTIATALKRVQAKYPSYNVSPHPVGISAWEEGNAMFVSGEPPAKGECPPARTLDDIIIITQGYLKQNSGTRTRLLGEVAIHESGHQIDYHRAGCKSFFSETPKFSNLYNLGAMYGDRYFQVLKDSEYTPEEDKSGHPNDNVHEGFASAFHATFSYKNQFQVKAKAASQTLGEINGWLLEGILLETGRIAAE